MTRWLRIVVALAVLLSVPLLTAVPAHAQTSGDNTGKIVSGSIPPDGGFGIIVYGGGTFDQLVAASGCPVARVIFWFTVDGNFVVFIPGTSVGAANAGAQAAFPTSTIPPNTALIGRCVPAGQSGIQGAVTRGPVCPVVRPDDPNCADQPYQATIVVYNAAAACPAFTCGEVARTTSGVDGQYRIALAPGRYLVAASSMTAQPSAYPLPPQSQEVQVPANVFVTVDFVFDTGIR